jgi:hypothetical protein
VGLKVGSTLKSSEGGEFGGSSLKSLRIVFEEFERRVLEMGVPVNTGLGLQVSDVSGQKNFTVSDAPQDSTVGELIQGLLGEMELPQNDVSGRPLVYQALLEREGRHLHASERVGDALQQGDQLVLQPNIDAGGC